MWAGSWANCLVHGISLRCCSHRSSSFPLLGALRSAGMENRITGSGAIGVSLEGLRTNCEFFISSGVSGTRIG